MADYVMPNGREITFDLTQLTYGQYLGLFDASESDERSDKTLARLSGLSVKELKGLPFLEYKKFLNTFLRNAESPSMNLMKKTLKAHLVSPKISGCADAGRIFNVEISL
jgi:hypothetical protein